jgi:hypothetical protein
VRQVEPFLYVSITANPPPPRQIVQRGMSRGNTVQLHRKVWLVLSDKYNRYGKKFVNPLIQYDIISLLKGWNASSTPIIALTVLRSRTR